MLYYSKLLFCYGEKEVKYFRVLQNNLWYSGSSGLQSLVSSEYKYQADNCHFLSGYVPVAGITSWVVMQTSLQVSLATTAGVPECQKILNFKSLLYLVTCSSIWCIKPQNVLLNCWCSGRWTCALLPAMLCPQWALKLWRTKCNFREALG